MQVSMKQQRVRLFEYRRLHHGTQFQLSRQGLKKNALLKSFCPRMLPISKRTL